MLTVLSTPIPRNGPFVSAPLAPSTLPELTSCFLEVRKYARRARKITTSQLETRQSAAHAQPGSTKTTPVWPIVRQRLSNVCGRICPSSISFRHPCLHQELWWCVDPGSSKYVGRVRIICASASIVHRENLARSAMWIYAPHVRSDVPQLGSLVARLASGVPVQSA
jgi:hypothetical protein